MKHILTTLLLIVILCISLYAQKTEVVVPGYWETSGTEGTLNTAIDAAISAGTLSNTIFKLKAYEAYVLTGSITTPSGQVLEIVGDIPGSTQETAPPMICWTASTAPSKTYLFDIAGEVKMKNVSIMWASLDGSRYTSTIRIGDSATVSGGRCEFENVMFDLIQQASSGAIQPFATHFKGYFKNCYWRNGTDPHFRYYSRAVSVPYSAQGIHIDTLVFENCTFANLGYVYMQEGGVYGDNVFFNHCTFYNIVMFTLESGWWHNMYVTNSLFMNTFMFGYIPNAPDGINGGTIAIAPIDSGTIGTNRGFGFVPDWNPQDGVADFTEKQRHIVFTNNCYTLDKWLVDWMGYGTSGSPYSKDKHRNRLDLEVPVPQPMFNGLTNTFFDSIDAEGNKAWPYINRKNNLEGITITATSDLPSTDEAWTYPIVALNSDYTPGLISPPINMDSLKTFLNKKWDDNSDIGWTWNPYASYNQVWPLVEDLSYTNNILKAAAMGGFPIGDLYRWWNPNIRPGATDYYTTWKAQASVENDTIQKWLFNGFGPQVGVKELPGIPKIYELGQNYPNPFNPVTQIKYSIPEQAQVTLKVYNTLGAEVSTLFSGVQHAGNYNVTFDGKALASGVYFYRLQAGNISITKKLILMK